MEAREFEAGMEFSGDGVAIYQSVVESLEECAIFMIDASGTMMSWNPGVESMLGYAREEFIGLHYEALFPAEEIGAAQRELEETRTNGRARDNRWHRRRDGGRFWADGVLVAVRDGERFIGYVKILRDDGDRRRLDEELAETRRQKERFLAMVSHELRTPLMAILGWVRVLQDGEVEAGDLRTALQIIEQNALAQRRLVEELIDAAQLITGSIELERSDIDLRATVLSEIDTARERATEKGIAFESSVGSEAVMMHADEQRIRQIIGGLLSNAVKYTLV
jgi:PAS domain S-box-containing protein